MVLQPQTQLSDPNVFLAGRPPISEYLAFLKSEAQSISALDDKTLADEWRAANDHIQELEASQQGVADNPTMQALGNEMQSLVTQLESHPIFKATYCLVPTTINVVELDTLVVFQKNINLRFVEELKARLGDSPSPEQIFRLCLPFDHPTPDVRSMQVGPGAFAFVSTSTDLRPLDLRVFRPDQIQNYVFSGSIAGVVGIPIGFGSNFLNAVSVENRLVLNNGSHRAYALRDIGISHVPCIVQHVSRREEIEMVAPPIAQGYDLLLKEARPPLLKDYFDSQLRKVVNVPRKLRQARVLVQVEVSEMPAI